MQTKCAIFHGAELLFELNADEQYTVTIEFYIQSSLAQREHYERYNVSFLQISKQGYSDGNNF